ncbi:hypothetical protein Amet_3368 [Alkaliphilus metalliredigens QYMF]|uniref:Uncharacterized protein n=1 Tax=Alkaliphilus metalliredigens (strain QYMF) TaxID=293826 RepID=A6TTH8_ALKMQ|nr:hypothetical protein [Alkaliphilus metalliredigens]ABR49496.1 hypothetical protein Amet_3368 [Alkaliphilus metalliredigens QYMF]
MKKLSVFKIYLNQKKESNFYESSKLMYERKLEVFEEFTYVYFSISEKNYKDLFRGFSKENIVKSMEFYLKNYNVNTKTTLNGYLTVLTDFFHYIADNMKVVNENFENRDKLNKLKEELNKLAKKYNLEKSQQKSPLTREAFVLLCAKCDEYIENYNIKNINKNGYDGEFSLYLSGIITKLLIVTAIKNSVIDSLKVNENYKYGMIKVNGYWVRLPDKLSAQLDNYVKNVRPSCNTNELNDLFVNRKGVRLCGNNNAYFAILKKLFGTMQSASVAKFRIIEMIRSGVAPNIITAYTGYALETYLHCLDILSSIDKEQLDEEYTKKINSDNMMWDYYYKL